MGEGRAPIEVPDELRRETEEHGWPDGLLESALEVGIPPGSIFGWLSWSPSPEHMEKRIEWHKRLTFGELRGREATLADADAFIELWANAPEEAGNWEVTTERGPNAFAQFRLQENVTLSVIADGNRLAACCGWARYNVLVAGQRLSVRYGQALRVHRDYRRQGFGDQVRNLSPGVGTIGPSATQYDYMRSQNFAVVNWWKKYDPDFFDDVPKPAGAVPGIPVTVQQYPARPFAGDPAGIRRARRSDTRRSVRLINRTHQGQDLFRPYTPEFLRGRLDEGFWGERPPWWAPVYGWSDYWVLEEGGSIVACAGLWDRGRDLRERWRRKEGGEELVISEASLLDFGYEAGAEAGMARLLSYLIGRTEALGRTNLVAPLGQLPELAARLEGHEPVPETRSLRWGMRELQITRPYIDLVYW